MNKIKFNPAIKLALADVDETIADVYTNATPEMISELDRFIEEGRILFLLSGGGLQSIRERIVDLLKPENRHRTLIAHCMGAEVWGFEKGGELKSKPYYSIYEGHFSEEQKHKWREIINILIEKFHLKTYPPQPTNSFVELTQGDPLSIMLADRGPQITFEFANSINLTIEQKERLEKELGAKIILSHGTYDLRYLVQAESVRLYQEANLPIVPKLAGTFALDHGLKGVDKTRAVEYILGNNHILSDLGLRREDMEDEREIEIWGDKYSQKKGGPDFFMCLAVSPSVRAIDFRDEDPSEVPTGYNIVMWDGKERLHEGLLEYLKNRE